MTYTTLSSTCVWKIKENSLPPVPCICAYYRFITMPIKSPKLLKRLFGWRTDTPDNTSEFTRIWNYHKKSIRNSGDLVKAVVTDVSTKIDSGRVEAEEIIRDGLQFAGESADPTSLRNREILLQLIDLLATHGVHNRELVRQVLTAGKCGNVFLCLIFVFCTMINLIREVAATSFAI